MQVTARHSRGNVVLTISDRTILGLFDEMNNNGPQRRIACNSSYHTGQRAVTEITLAGYDVRPPATLFNRFRKWIGLKR